MKWFDLANVRIIGDSSFREFTVQINFRYFQLFSLHIYIDRSCRNFLTFDQPQSILSTYGHKERLQMCTNQMNVDKFWL